MALHDPPTETQRKNAEGPAVVKPKLPTQESDVSICLTAFFMAICLMASHGFASFSLFDGYLIPTEDYSRLLSTPPLYRYLGYGGLAVLACQLWWSTRNLPIRVEGSQKWLLAFTAWCGVSLFWSTDFSLGVKRFVLLVLFTLLAWGLGRKWSLPALLRLFTVCSLVVVVVSLALEVSLGTFSPLDPSYRFAGIFHPNQQAANLVVLLSSLYLLIGFRPVPSPVLGLLCVCGLALLVLTGSRNCATALTLALLGAHFLRIPLQYPRAISAALTSGALLAFLGFRYFYLDLNGRGTLWTAALRSCQERLALGFGYGSYWTSERVRDLSQLLGWAVPNAHSSILDLVLGCGLVGLAVYGVWLNLTLAESLSGPSTIRQRFRLLQCILALVIGSLESTYAFPTTLLALCLLSSALSPTQTLPVVPRNARTESVLLISSAICTVLVWWIRG
jgi:O-antigen ligase